MCNKYSPVLWNDAWKPGQRSLETQSESGRQKNMDPETRMAVLAKASSHLLETKITSPDQTRSFIRN
jgi:hypothetical protein